MGPLNINRAEEVVLVDWDETDVEGLTDNSCALACLCAFSF